MRETIIWIIFLVLLALAAFEGGYIVRDRRKDDTRERVLKLETKATDLSGRMVILEGPPSKVQAKSKK